MGMKKPASAKGLKESPNKKSRKEEEQAPDGHEAVATAEETEKQKQEGLQESQPTDSEEAPGAAEPEAAQKEDEGLKEGQAEAAAQKEDEGLKEGQAEAVATEDLAATGSEAAAAKVFEEAAAKAAKAGLTEVTSEAGLKEGRLSETAFWKEISSKDRGALYKKYEEIRNKDPEAKEAWLQMAGPGILEKKKQLLLHFLKTGQAQEGGLKKS
eukprot:s19_g4.t1